MAQLDIMAIAWKSWNLVKRHRFLWGLGLLAGSGGSLYSWMGSNPGPMDDSSSVNVTSEDTWKTVSAWISAHPAETQALAAGLAALFLLLIYVSYAARAGLILSVNYLEEKEKADPPTFSEAFRDGRGFFWRLLGVTVALALLIGTMLGVAGFLLFLIGSRAGGDGPYVSITLETLLLLAVSLLFLAPWIAFAERAAVLGGYGVFESIRRGWALLAANLKQTFLVALGAFLSSLALGLAIGLALVSLILLAVGVGFLAYSAIQFGPVSVGIWVALGLVILMFTLAAGGVAGAFSSAYWTVSYRALAYLAMSQEEGQ